MRIWAFPSFYPYDAPGHTYSGIFAHRQYKGLIGNGADLQVICPISWAPPYPFSLLHPEWKELNKIVFPEERVYDGIKVHHPRIANMKPSRFVKKTYEERYVDCIAAFFKRKNIKLSPETDVFYSQWLPSSRMVTMAAHKLGVKSAVLSIGDDVVLWPNGSSHNMQLFRQMMHDADYVFSCAEYLGRLANKTLGEEIPFGIARWGVDHDFFKPVSHEVKEELRKAYNIPADRVTILNIGTATPRKGWIDLFDALARIKQQGIDFVLLAVHTGKPEFDFASETAKRGLADNFIDIGEMKPTALAKIYNLSDIFCLPSHSEGLANVVVEAMSCGLPVITTIVGGHSELITNDVNGILIPPQAPDLLYEQLLPLIADNAKRTALGKAARSHIVDVWGNYAKSTKELYRKICKV